MASDKIPIDPTKSEHNFVIDNGNLFGDESARIFDGEPVEVMPAGTTFHHLLAHLGIFSSASQARKDSKWGQVSLPEGFSDFKNVGKLKLRISVLNPCTVDRELLERLDKEEK
jgi:hypothetical protein